MQVGILNMKLQRGKAQTGSGGEADGQLLGSCDEDVHHRHDSLHCGSAGAWFNFKFTPSKYLVQAIAMYTHWQCELIFLSDQKLKRPLRSLVRGALDLELKSFPSTHNVTCWASRYADCK